MLPSLPTGLTLKAITIGRGTQNYTCASSTASDKPVSIGAVATLFDATDYLPQRPEDGLPFLAYLVATFLDFPREVLEQYRRLEIVGSHFVDASGAPTFDLTAPYSGHFRGKKIAGVAAPAESKPGPFGQGNGAVDWVALTAIDGAAGLGFVYRVATAGGKPPATCAGAAANIEEQYATEYWFYG